MTIFPLSRKSLVAPLAAAGLGLAAGCAEQTASAPPPAVAVETPSSSAPDAPAFEAPPVGDVALQPPPPAVVDIAVQKQTPPEPLRFRFIEPGAPPPKAHVVLVNMPPPPPMAEPIPREPGPRHQWCPGCWRFRGGQYYWVHGRWIDKPSARAVLVPPHWESQGTGVVFVEGYWQLR